MLSYDLVPPPTSSPLSRDSVVSLSQSSCVSQLELNDGRGGGGGGGGAKLYDRPRESLVLYKTGKTEALNGMFYSKSIWMRKTGRGSHV